MQSKIHYVCFYIVLHNFVILEAQKVDTSNLLGLLDHASAKLNSDKIGNKNITKSLEQHTKVSLLEDIEQEETNTNYQDALKILSDKAMKMSYQNNLGIIQLLLLDCMSQILQKHASSFAKKQKFTSLADLLDKIVPASSNASHVQLSNLMDLLEKITSNSITPKSIQASLKSLLLQNTEATLHVPAKTVNLEELLKSSSTNSTVQSSIDKTLNLANLLPSGS